MIAAGVGLEGLPMPQSPAPMCAGPAVPVLDPGIRVPRELLRELRALIWLQDDAGLDERLERADALLVRLLAEPPAFVNPGNETGGVPVGWVDPREGGA